jgi:hypothetical protein
VGEAYNRRMRSFVPALLVAALTACASSDFRASGAGEALPPHEGPVAVLSRLPPPGTYRLLGIVTVNGVRLTSDERMFEQLTERAAARGADAVVPQGRIRVRPTTEGGEQRTLAAYAIRRR